MFRELGRKLWVRESRFAYRGRAHHRIEHVFLGRTIVSGQPLSTISVMDKLHDLVQPWAGAQDRS